MEIQAKREANNGFKFSIDTVWQEEFEEGFPYNETKDQLKAIQEVKNDMESYKVMDRIVCGDVGYGKTEVALRAAFKATMNQKQVVLLAPTTVLAYQHYERFIERFKNFPLNIKLLSRLEGEKEQKNDGGLCCGCSLLNLFYDHSVCGRRPSDCYQQSV